MFLVLPHWAADMAMERHDVSATPRFCYRFSPSRCVWGSRGLQKVRGLQQVAPSHLRRWRSEAGHVTRQLPPTSSRKIQQVPEPQQPIRARLLSAPPVRGLRSWWACPPLSWGGSRDLGCRKWGIKLAAGSQTFLCGWWRGEEVCDVFTMVI